MRKMYVLRAPTKRYFAALDDNDDPLTTEHVYEAFLFKHPEDQALLLVQSSITGGYYWDTVEICNIVPSELEVVKPKRRISI